MKSHLPDTKGPGVGFCQYFMTCFSLNKKGWNKNGGRKDFMTNFNIRMVLDWKSKPVAAWSLVRPIPPPPTHTHTHARTHAQYARFALSKSRVQVQIILFKNVLPHAMLPREGYRSMTWMTRIRVCIRVCQHKMKTPARLLICHGKSSAGF